MQKIPCQSIQMSTKVLIYDEHMLLRPYHMISSNPSLPKSPRFVAVNVYSPYGMCLLISIKPKSYKP